AAPPLLQARPSLRRSANGRALPRGWTERLLPARREGRGGRGRRRDRAPRAPPGGCSRLRDHTSLRAGPRGRRRCAPRPRSRRPAGRLAAVLRAAARTYRLTSAPALRASDRLEVVVGVRPSAQPQARVRRIRGMRTRQRCLWEEMTQVALVSDGELLQRIAANDPAAFDELYRRFAPPVLRLALRWLRDRLRAEDATQETFAAVWRSAATYRPERGPGAPWLYAVARNAIVNQTRSRIVPVAEIPESPSDRP